MTQVSHCPEGEAGPDTIAPFEDLDGGPPQVLTTDGDVQLAGVRSSSSGVPAFPARSVCPETGARDMEPARFGPDATLYSFSTIHASATREVPYTLGYIDFPDGLRTLAIVKGDDLRCDMPVTLRASGDDWWVEART